MFKKDHKINNNRTPHNKGIPLTKAQKENLSKKLKGLMVGKKHPNYSHGMSGKRPYITWSGMVSRCHDVKNKSYERYGGAGVKVCKAWKESFASFWLDMEKGYEDKKQIDRIDNAKGYFKENCRWVSVLQQARNRRCVRLYKLGKREMTLRQWDIHLGLRYGTVRSRIFILKWSIKKALTAPKTTYLKTTLTTSQKKQKHLSENY